MRKKILPLSWREIGLRRTFLLRLVFMVVLALSITIVLTAPIGQLPLTFREGEIAPKDIFADQNYKFIDNQATEKLGEDAADKILPVYDYELDMASVRKAQLETAFQRARDNLNKTGLVHGQHLSEDEEKFVKKEFFSDLLLELSDESYLLLRRDKFSEEMAQVLTVLLEPLQKKFISHDKSNLAIREDTGIVMRVVRPSLATADSDPDLILQQYPEEETILDASHILGLEEAQQYYAKKTALEIQESASLDFILPEKIKQALVILPGLIQANLHLNKVETELRRDKARKNFQNTVYKEIQKGQIIISRGNRYTQSEIAIISALKSAKLKTNQTLRFTGIFTFVMLVMALLTIFSNSHLSHFSPSLKDLFFAGIFLLGTLLGIRVASLFGTLLKDGVNFPLDLTAFYYVIPSALGSLLIGYILNSQIALIYALVLAVCSSVYYESQYAVSVFLLLTNIFAAHIIPGVERRSTVISCGFYLGLFNAGVVLCLNFMTTMSSPEAIDSGLLATHVIAAFIGGVSSALGMLAVSPVVESVFNYTTNIKLLELANMNHPLLREMIVRAPGTYHHSQLVGILSEAGARSIKGNSLLARVASYYHDIGKMKKPQYFIENQKGVNPHDRLPPSMSALIIAAHVKDGLELAAEYKLPKIIVDMIPEHQGTKLIGFFYEKARQKADASRGVVEEKDFRYPGPKPQSREAGVIMMADAVEAAVRSLPEKSPQKIQAMVEKLVNKHFSDGQLNECNLTLRDLSLVIEAFVKILIGIYHQRVEYPETKSTPLTLVTRDTDAPKDKDLQQTSIH